MIDHVWSVLCTKAVIDRDTNLLTLVDIVEELTVEMGRVLHTRPGGVEVLSPDDVPPDQFPVIPVEIEVVSFWVRRAPDEPATGVARLMLVPPGEEPRLLGKPYDLDLTGNFKRLRTRVRLSGMPARTSGRHMILVQLKDDQDSETWQEVTKVPLDIVLKDIVLKSDQDDAPPDS